MLILRWQANIVVDKEGRARLTSYGLGYISPDLNLSTAHHSDTSWWIAPELMDPPPTGGIAYDERSDVFFFGMVILEVFVGLDPSYGPKHLRQALIGICKGVNSNVPPNLEKLGLTNEMREIMERCWKKPDERPSMDEVVKLWRGFVSDTSIKVLDGCPLPSEVVNCLETC